MAIVVTFTTVPNRILHLNKVIDSIYCNQTIKPDYVVLYVPYNCKRTNESYDIPEYLADLQKNTTWFIIKRVDEDLGPITKVYYSFLDYTDPNDKLISIDDDICYEKHFIEELLAGHQAHPEALLGFMGGIGGNFLHSELIQMNHIERVFRKVEGLGGYKGILYPRKFIDDEFFVIVKELTQIHIEKQNTPILEDDNLLRLYFAQKHIDCIIVGTFYPINLYGPTIYDIINIEFLDTSKIGGLYSLGNNEHISNSFKLIKEYFKVSN
jgi:hypothetical protein